MLETINAQMRQSLERILNIRLDDIFNGFWQHCPSEMADRVKPVTMLA